MTDFQILQAGRALRILRLAKVLSLVRLLRLSRLVRYVSQWEEVYVSIVSVSLEISLKLSHVSIKEVESFCRRMKSCLGQFFSSFQLTQDLLSFYCFLFPPTIRALHCAIAMITTHILKVWPTKTGDGTVKKSTNIFSDIQIVT